MLAAIPSKTASGSDAVLGDPFSDRLETYSSLGKVQNTVSGDGLSCIAYYYNASYDKLESMAVPITSRNGSWHISAQLNAPNYFTSVVISLKKGSLPPSGTYDISFDYSSDISFDTHIFGYWYQKFTDNAQTYSDSILAPYKVSAGDIYSAPYRFNLTNVYELDPNFAFSGDSIRNISGDFAINFTPASSDPSAPSTGIDTSQQDYESGVSSSLSDIQSSVGNMSSDLSEAAQSLEYISQSQDLIIKGIDNIILHISDQLYAFWDQLYNFIHVPTMAKLDQILTAIQRMANNSDIHAVVDQIKESTDKQTGEIIANDNANTQKVEQAVEKHGNFIIEGLKGLFIPSDTFFKTWFDEQYQFFHDRLGFLMLPIDILIQFIGIFQAATTGTPGIPFPEFKWIDGTVIIPAQTVGFDFLSTDWGEDIQSKLYFVGNVIMIGALLSLIHKKLEEVLRG